MNGNTDHIIATGNSLFHFRGFQKYSEGGETFKEVTKGGVKGLGRSLRKKMVIWPIIF